MAARNDREGAERGAQGWGGMDIKMKEAAKGAGAGGVDTQKIREQNKRANRDYERG